MLKRIETIEKRQPPPQEETYIEWITEAQAREEEEAERLNPADEAKGEKTEAEAWIDELNEEKRKLHEKLAWEEADRTADVLIIS